MKESEVPQDSSNLSENKIKELCYAVDPKGQYTTALSSGWEPKSIVQKETRRDIQQRINQAQAAVKSGTASPIVYFMEYHKMDWNIVSAYVKMWKWRVKRHAKPQVFSKLNNKILGRYAEAFDISIDQLKNYKGD